jgi:hypothetical protein
MSRGTSWLVIGISWALIIGGAAMISLTGALVLAAFMVAMAGFFLHRAGRPRRDDENLAAEPSLQPEDLRRMARNAVLYGLMIAVAPVYLVIVEPDWRLPICLMGVGTLIGIVAHVQGLLLLADESREEAEG